MTDRARYPDDQPDEVPVPLVEPPCNRDDVERPVELSTDVVREAERILETAFEETTELRIPGAPPHPARVGEATPRRTRRKKEALGALRRRVGVTLLTLACVAAFAHGWHVGSRQAKERAQQQSEDLVNEITDHAAADL